MHWRKTQASETFTHSLSMVVLMFSSTAVRWNFIWQLAVETGSGTSAWRRVQQCFHCSWQLLFFCTFPYLAHHLISAETMTGLSTSSWHLVSKWLIWSQTSETLEAPQQSACCSLVFKPALCFRYKLIHTNNIHRVAKNLSGWLVKKLFLQFCSLF